MTKTAILFPGQGAQYVGMCKEIYDAYTEVRETFEEAEDVLGRNLTTLCFEGPEDQLNLTQNTQPCLTACEVALFRLLTNQGVEPYVLAGFSLGEYPALIAADVISFEQGMKLVETRALLMQSAVRVGEGGMLAILKQDEPVVRELCNEVGEGIWPANFNCPGQIVCAGKSEALDKAEAIAKSKKIMTVRLAVSVPSHCPLMEQAAQELEQYASELVFSNAKIPVVCNVDGEVETEGAMLKEKLIQQLTQPVLFEKSLRTIHQLGVRSFIEAGPGKVLSSFGKKTLKEVNLIQVGNLSGISTVLELMA